MRWQHLEVAALGQAFIHGKPAVTLIKQSFTVADTAATRCSFSETLKRNQTDCSCRIIDVLGSGFAQGGANAAARSYAAQLRTARYFVIIYYN